jgi:hypothetical protein
MSGDVEIALTAIGVTLFALAWATLVGWAAWRLGRKKDPPAGEG